MSAGVSPRLASASTRTVRLPTCAGSTRIRTGSPFRLVPSMSVTWHIAMRPALVLIPKPSRRTSTCGGVCMLGLPSGAHVPNRAWHPRPRDTCLVGAEGDRVLPGSPFPLGATPEAGGTNFAVASGVADSVTLCLFDGSGGETQLPLPSYDAGVWYGFVPGVGPGQAYAYRVTGAYEPAQPSALDSAGHVPRGLVVDEAFDWTDGDPARRRYSDTIIYEVHVKGFT